MNSFPSSQLFPCGIAEIVTSFVRFTDGEKAALRATKEGKSGGNTGATTDVFSVRVVAVGVAVGRSTAFQIRWLRCRIQL